MILVHFPNTTVTSSWTPW